jgi:hypothetical protein
MTKAASGVRGSKTGPATVKAAGNFGTVEDKFRVGLGSATVEEGETTQAEETSISSREQKIVGGT